MNAARHGVGLARRWTIRRPVAWVTAVVGAATLAVSVAALASPALMQAMTRDLTRLRAGQWWRLVTPVLVQPDGWGQLLFNLLGLVVVGLALEGRTSRSAWSFVYLLGGVGGVAVTMWWHPTDLGGGSSDAVAALIGAFAVLVAVENHGRDDRRSQASGASWPAQLYAVFFAGYLTALDLGGVWWSIAAGNASIIGFAAARHAFSPFGFARACLIFVVTAGVTMTIQQDGHGFGIIVGAAIASVILARRPRRGVPA